MMKEQSINNVYKWKEYDMVEIRVVSALGHVWAEASHDVLYKTHAYGRLSIQEQRILDALSGLMVSGDLLLEQFRELVAKRTTAKWEHPDVLDNCKGYQDDCRPDAVNILFCFLKRTGNNYPLAVRNALKLLGYPQDPKVGTNKILSRFSPSLPFPQGFLAPFHFCSYSIIVVASFSFNRHHGWFVARVERLVDSSIVAPPPEYRAEDAKPVEQ